jgi:BirA family biotin operon repressor/biotin-[acetyl-CoA-carboxylase] ligase
VKNTPWGGRVEFSPTTVSTMDDAQAMEDRGVPDGSLAWAGFQTAGRGRHPGRVWLGEPGASLMFTVWWHPHRFRVPGFAASLTVGLGVCLWLEGLGLPTAFPVALKWPNDVFLADRKVAGILVRQRWGASGPGSIHAGIGVNLADPGDQSGFRTAAVSLAEAGSFLTAEQALESLLRALALALDHPDPRAACEQRLWKKDQEIQLSLPDGQGRPWGLARGLDEAGRLIWETADGLQTLSSGE